MQIFQGIAPTFIGSISDETGRRPSYLICFVIYLGANIGLALQSSYPALFLLRCLQSSGSSATVALANAVVADLVTSAERGSYIGYATVGALVGPAFGPVVGGLLCQYLGWRSVFWFLTIYAGILVVIFATILPETCRKVVGNGSIPPQKWNVSLLTYLNLRSQRKAGSTDAQMTLAYKPRINPLNSVRILFDKESGLILLYSGIIFSGFYMVVTAMPSQLQQHYGFNTLQIGLCYIPSGCGSLTAAFLIGRLNDWNFRRLAKKQGMVIDKRKQQDIANFPIELSRLQVTIPLVAISGVHHWVRLGDGIQYLARRPSNIPLHLDLLPLWRLQWFKHLNRRPESCKCGNCYSCDESCQVLDGSRSSRGRDSVGGKNGDWLDLFRYSGRVGSFQPCNVL